MFEDDYDDDGYVGYVPTTVDAGRELLIGTTIFCILSQVLLPLWLRWGKRCKRRRQERELREQQECATGNARTSSNKKWKPSKSRSSGNSNNNSSSNGVATSYDQRSILQEDEETTTADVHATKSKFQVRDSINVHCTPNGDLESTLVEILAGDDEDIDENASSRGHPHIYSPSSNQWLEQAEPQRATNSWSSSCRRRDGASHQNGSSSVQKQSLQDAADDSISGISGLTPTTRYSRTAGNKTRNATTSFLPQFLWPENHSLQRQQQEEEQQQQQQKPAQPMTSRPKYYSSVTGGRSLASGASSTASSISILDAGVKRRRGAGGGGGLRLKTTLDRERRHRNAAMIGEGEHEQLPQQRELSSVVPNNSINNNNNTNKSDGDEDRPSFCDSLLELFEYDKEAKRIVELAAPLTVTEVVTACMELVVIMLISKNLGTAAVTAFAVVDIILEFSYDFLLGITDSITTLSSQAIGARNYKLAGQYVQITAFLYVLCQMPFVFLWSFCLEDILLWLDLSEEVAQLGQEVARIQVISLVVSGLEMAYGGFLEVSDHENYAMVVGVVQDLSTVAIVAGALMLLEVSLTTIVLIELIIDIIFLVFLVAFPLWVGWMDKYKEGLFGTGALVNGAAIMAVLKTSVPLAIGSLLGSCEWEILTVFASYMGPAEVAAWALMAYPYDIFEASTESIGDAAEIRCAFLLGRNNPKMAKRSSYKSIILAVVVSFVITSIFFIIGDTLPTWMTSDPTLQHMIHDLIPLVGIGNITMTFGMVCWALVGAQGRYHLATLIALLSSWFVTLPLSALFVYGFNLDLRGMTSALVIGYSLAGTILSYVLLSSDWEELSSKVYQLQQLEADDSSSSSSDDDSDDSSSASSSSDSSSPNSGEEKISAA